MFFFGAKSSYRLDKPYRAYTDKIFNVDSRVFKALCYIDHKAQIPFNKDLLGILVLGKSRDYLCLLRARQRWWEQIGSSDIVYSLGIA
jgi:hypothetical protein